MAGSVNKVIIVGNLGKDPEVRNSAAGQKIVNFSVATSDVWKDKSGQKQEKTEWHRVVIFNPNLAEIASKYLHKGSKVYIEGALQTRKWTDNSGQDKYTTEIVISSYKGELTLLDSKGAADGSSSSGAEWGASSSTDGWDTPSAVAAAEAPDDSIPF